jgi:hypothetical protein
MPAPSGYFFRDLPAVYPDPGARHVLAFGQQTMIDPARCFIFLTNSPLSRTNARDVVTGLQSQTLLSSPQTPPRFFT